MQKFTLIALVATSVFVVGCSKNNPKAANERNFKEAAQRYLDTAYPKCYLLFDFPSKFQLEGGSQPRLMQALTKAGIVREASRTPFKPNLFSPGGSTFVFDLTEEGRKHYKKQATTLSNGQQMGGFCFGRATLKEVTQFTEPADLMGYKVSTVNFSYSVSEFGNVPTAVELLIVTAPG